jgi:hypothetical protein
MNLIKIFSRICAKTEGELVRVPTKKTTLQEYGRSIPGQDLQRITDNCVPLGLVHIIG